MQKYQQVLSVLKRAQEEVNAVLADPDDEYHRIKINTELQRSHDFLAAVSGIGDIGDVGYHKLGPAKTIMGKKIEYKANTKPEDVKPDETRVQKLKDKVEALYDSFMTITSEDLVKNYEDTVIRGVAKKAKMKGITKDNPAKVTIDFVDQIKLEIQLENERQEKLNPEGPKKAAWQTQIDKAIADQKGAAVLDMNPENTEFTDFDNPAGTEGAGIPDELPE